MTDLPAVPLLAHLKLTQVFLRKREAPTVSRGQDHFKSIYNLKVLHLFKRQLKFSYSLQCILTSAETLLGFIFLSCLFDS